MRTGQHLAFFNVNADECLIYVDRNVGGDIGWPSTERWEEQLKDLAINVAKEEGKRVVMAALLA